MQVYLPEQVGGKEKGAVKDPEEKYFFFFQVFVDISFMVAVVDVAKL
ncbi:MAG: hypothetical protein LC630_06850 [Bacteroidales bacterium]|nr:hypothetical protein [Bacteroidales bacterium]